MHQDWPGRAPEDRPGRASTSAPGLTGQSTIGPGPTGHSRTRKAWGRTMARVTGAEGCPGLALLLLLALPLGHTGDFQRYSYVLSCQPGAPRTLLSATFNEDEMFHFDFQTGRTEARLPDFRRWQQYPFDLPTIPDEAALCRLILGRLDGFLVDTMPQARGTPVLDVFTRHPLELGKPNTLICFISNFFPPVLNVTWTRGNVPVTSGVWTTDYLPTTDGGFYFFSYLNITPAPHDVYSCSVTQDNEQYSSVKNWLPKNPVSSDLLENVLCGLALSLGMVGIAVGIILLVKARKPQQTE